MILFIDTLVKEVQEEVCVTVLNTEYVFVRMGFIEDC